MSQFQKYTFREKDPENYKIYLYFMTTFHNFPLQIDKMELKERFISFRKLKMPVMLVCMFGLKKILYEKE